MPGGLLLAALLWIFPLLTHGYVPLIGWGASANSELYTPGMNKTLLHLLLDNRNITDVVMSEQAVALRIGRPDEDVAALWEANQSQLIVKPRSKKSADASRKAAFWVFLGSASEGGEVPTYTRDYLSTLKQKPYTLEIDNDAQPTTIDYCSGVETDCSRNAFIANDVCALSNAFVAVTGTHVVCVGPDSICRMGEWNETQSEDNTAEGVLCTTTGVSAVAFLSRKSKGKGVLLSFLGENWSSAPYDNVNVAGLSKGNWPTVLEGNRNATAMLLQGGAMITWGAPAMGGRETADFVVSVVANDLGFAAMTTLGTAITVPDTLAVCLPQRVQQGGTAQVVQVQGKGECFVAYLKNGTIAVWGRGEQLYCCEEGASNSKTYKSFMSVANDIKGNVTEVVMAGEAMAARSYDGSLVAWGLIEGGGDVTDNPDVKDAMPGSLCASSGTFGFLRNDGKVVVWGAENTGAKLDNSFAQLGAITLASSLEGFALLSKERNLYRWPGATAAYMTFGDTSAGFHLDAAVQGVFGGEGGFVAVLGTPCGFSEWTDWSACSSPCDGGTRSRSRTQTTPSLNAPCNGNLTEIEDCNVEPCAVEDSPLRAKDVPVKVWVAAAVGVVGLVGVPYVCWARTRESAGDEEYMD